MARFPSFWRKNNYVNDAGNWVKQEGTGDADPHEELPLSFHKTINYVWDPETEEWVPQEA